MSTEDWGRGSSDACVRLLVGCINNLKRVRLATIQVTLSNLD